MYDQYISGHITILLTLSPSRIRWNRLIFKKSKTKRYVIVQIVARRDETFEKYRRM